jgi:hypothetical protein
MRFFVFFVFWLALLSEAQAQVKIARLKPDGKGYEIVADARSLRKAFVNLFSTPNDYVTDPTNISIKESTGKKDLLGAVFLVAESRMGQEGMGSKVMRIYLVRGSDGFLYLPPRVVGEMCANVDCTRCAFDDDSGCFCGLRGEDNNHVVGCAHYIFSGENTRK